MFTSRNSLDAARSGGAVGKRDMGIYERACFFGNSELLGNIKIIVNLYLYSYRHLTVKWPQLI
jgi:hypothetical protein